MVRLKSLACLLPLALFLSGAGGASAASPPQPVEEFVATNGVVLQVLDWGGSGPALIFIHGLADDPHVFDDLVPAFTGKFRVIAYARRGSGSSDAKGPYDAKTLGADLLGLMDALKIDKADLAGYSAGGDEVTTLAVEHPDRVAKAIYLEGGYDWSDPEFRAAVKVLPVDFFNLPPSARSSLVAYLAYEKANQYPSLDDIGRVGSDLMAKVVFQPDGSLRNRMPPGRVAALFAALQENPPRDYRRMTCPVLAIYADHEYDTANPDPAVRTHILAYEKAHWKPFQAHSIARVRQEIADVTIVQVPGAHGSFLMTSRDKVVAAMRKFLLP
jgi:pimeloyl-ACP methyl ester carboxylesterase